ncbi:trypsin-like peptidase domain-containing protein [Candidatus Entotheonella palauensis]|uniref:trypsin-like peptidase domain-containing protein n=1 Tax=Candidatus Entotheonella palauensis TaxID=93172 RepID=UPI000B7C66E4|nr:trypsin-like peptidase domain-containing protein [Candidatus Entotheonella palauensis]
MHTNVDIAAPAKRLRRFSVMARWCSVAVLTLLLTSPGRGVAQDITPAQPGRYAAPYDQSRGVHSYAPLIKKAMRSVVRIHTLKRVKVKGKMQLKRASVGTGVVIDAGAGLVMTNEHVVAPGKVWAVEPTDQKPLPAQLIGADKATDLALLKADLTNIPAIKFADSAVLEVGDLVFAIGYPFGLDQTVSSGIISGLNRRGFADSSKEIRVEDFIQTDAAINSGNSGGPLVNSAGMAVGINTFILSKSGDSTGLGFSVPSRIAVAVARQLRQFGQVRRGVLGVALDTLTPESAKALGVDVDSGALLTQVRPNTPAAQVGLQVGDVITGAGRQLIESATDFLNFIRLVPANEPVRLYVRRGGEALLFEVALRPLGGRQTQSARSSTSPISGHEPSHVFYGATFAARPKVITPGAGASGVSVASVQKGSLAHSRGLRVADVVTHVNRQPIGDLAAFSTAMRAPGTAILTVLRGQSSFLVILSR